VGILSEMEFNMGFFTFHRQMKFNLRKRGFIRVMKVLQPFFYLPITYPTIFSSFIRVHLS
jgi:hypothetical protein